MIYDELENINVEQATRLIKYFQKKIEEEKSNQEFYFLEIEDEDQGNDCYTKIDTWEKAIEDICFNLYYNTNSKNTQTP